MDEALIKVLYQQALLEYRKESKKLAKKPFDNMLNYTQGLAEGAILAYGTVLGKEFEEVSKDKEEANA